MREESATSLVGAGERSDDRHENRGFSRRQLEQETAALQSRLASGSKTDNGGASVHYRHKVADGADVESGISRASGGAVPDLIAQTSTRWLELAESGLELDIYTCLGLSDAFSLTRDTRTIVKDVCFVTALQVIVPALMLALEVQGGLVLSHHRLPPLPLFHEEHARGCV